MALCTVVLAIDIGAHVILPDAVLAPEPVDGERVVTPVVVIAGHASGLLKSALAELLSVIGPTNAKPPVLVNISRSCTCLIVLRTTGAIGGPLSVAASMLIASVSPTQVMTAPSSLELSAECLWGRACSTVFLCPMWKPSAAL